MRRHIEIGRHEAIVLTPVDAQHGHFLRERLVVAFIGAVHDNGVTPVVTINVMI
jgi:hypothetical protein